MFVIMSIFLTIFELFTAGYSTAKGHWDSAIPAGVLGLFWLATLWLIHTQRIRDVERESLNREIEILDKCAQIIKKINDKAIADLDPSTKQDVDKFIKIMKENSPDEPPKTDEQLESLMAAYYQATGRIIVLSFHRDEDGKILGLDFKFSDREDAPEATTASTAVHVPVSAAEIPKPPTKSQQRRINDKKGRGPITDGEWKQQQNEKRRATREAKKAATALTSTTLKERIENDK
jgi:hypothetical protein